MAHHAGFAIALTLRERLINDMLLAAYASGRFRRTFSTSDLPGGQLLGGPPSVVLNAYLAPPRVDCLAGTMRLVLSMWGRMGIAVDGVGEAADVEARLTLLFPPHFFVAGDSLELLIGSSEVIVANWEFTPISPGGFSPASDAYLRSAEMRGRLQQGIRLLLAAGGFPLPKIPLGFLSSLPLSFATAAASRVRPGAVMVGLSLEDDTSIVGNPDLLADFAQANDFAAAMNPAALRLILAEMIKPGLAEQGATLQQLDLASETGRIRISGKANKSGFSASFSFSLVPVLVASTPGKTLVNSPRSVSVKPRTWPAFGFAVEDADVDAPSLLVSLLTLGIANIVVEFLGIVAEAEHAIANSSLPAMVRKVQRLKSPGPSGTTMRIEIAQSDLTTSGLYFGIRVSLEAPVPVLAGPVSIPADRRDEALNYGVGLPIGVHSDDPQLRIRWTVINPLNGAALVTRDGPAFGRDTFSFVPEAVAPSLQRMRVGVRVYRVLGPKITDFVNDSVVLEIRGPLPPGAYVRWHYEVSNPQVRHNEKSNDYHYEGQLVVKRRSKLHRTDRPCANQARRSRYTHDEHFFDTLPIPLSDLPERRSVLCDYCFYGRPGGPHLSL